MDTTILLCMDILYYYSILLLSMDIPINIKIFIIDINAVIKNK